MRVACYDQDINRSELLGETQVPISRLLRMNPDSANSWLPLNSSGEKAVELLLHGKYIHVFENNSQIDANESNGRSPVRETSNQFLTTMLTTNEYRP